LPLDGVQRDDQAWTPVGPRASYVIDPSPLLSFCPMPSCRWRGARSDEFKAHLRKFHPGNDRELSHIYDTKLVLDYIKEGALVGRVQKYALDFVRERALEQGKMEEWEDLCGRRAKAGWCHYDG
jgi:hypothetical protein